MLGSQGGCQIMLGETRARRNIWALCFRRSRRVDAPAIHGSLRSRPTHTLARPTPPSEDPPAVVHLQVTARLRNGLHTCSPPPPLTPTSPMAQRTTAAFCASQPCGEGGVLPTPTPRLLGQRQRRAALTTAPGFSWPHRGPRAALLYQRAAPRLRPPGAAGAPVATACAARSRARALPARGKPTQRAGQRSARPRAVAGVTGGGLPPADRPVLAPPPPPPGYWTLRAHGRGAGRDAKPGNLRSDAQLGWAALASRAAGGPALHRSPGRAAVVSKNFYGPAMPGAARQVIIIGFGEWDVLAWISGPSEEAGPTRTAGRRCAPAAAPPPSPCPVTRMSIPRAH